MLFYGKIINRDFILKIYGGFDMKKVEEFQETKKLINEYKELGDKIPELESKIELNKAQATRRIARIKEEMEMSWEDVEFNISKDELAKQSENQIKQIEEELEIENSDLEKQINDTNDARKFFRTDANFKTITMEIEEIKKEIVKEELDLKKLETELQEFYIDEEKRKENPLRWQEIYKETDAIKNNIKELNKILEEYSKFKEELNSINLTPEEYKKMLAMENERIAKNVEPTNPEPTNPEPTNPEPTNPEPTNPEPTNPEPTNPEPTNPEPTNPEPTNPEPTNPEPTNPEPTNPRPTNPEPTNPEPTNPEPTNPEPTNPEVFKPQLPLKNIKITICPYTNTIVLEANDKNGKPFMVYQELNYDKKNGKEVRKNIVDKYALSNSKKLDPNVLSILDLAGCETEIDEYTGVMDITDDREGIHTFDLHYDLDYMYKSNKLNHGEKRYAAKLAKQAKEIKGVSVSKKRTGIFAQLGSLLTASKQKKLTEARRGREQELYSGKNSMERAKMDREEPEAVSAWEQARRKFVEGIVQKDIVEQKWTDISDEEKEAMIEEHLYNFDDRYEYKVGGFKTKEPDDGDGREPGDE